MVVVDRECRREDVYMSTKNQAKYSDQFKAEAAAMVIELGKSQVVVCRELGET